MLEKQLHLIVLCHPFLGVAPSYRVGRYYCQESYFYIGGKELTLSKCDRACRGMSSMYSWRFRNNYGHCNCYPGATVDGTCTQSASSVGTTLYRYRTPGK